VGEIGEAARIERKEVGMPMAVTVQNKGDRLDGIVAGLYASLDLMGIATHSGERTHSHWVSPEQRPPTLTAGA
jgi:hypothetical protein